MSATARKQRPRTVEEAVRVTTDLTPEERELLNSGRDDWAEDSPKGARLPSAEDIKSHEQAAPRFEKGKEPVGEDEFEADVPEQASAIPPWVQLPPEVVLPEGYQVYFVRFRAEWTNTPKKGDRWCALWNLSESDEKFALKRTFGESIRSLDEMTKQMVRVTGFVTDPASPGAKVDWGRGHHALSTFWSEIGGKCRQQLKNLFVKNHSLGVEEATDFFSNCVAVLTVGG